jgi:serine/threonine protein kinase
VNDEPLGRADGALEMDARLEVGARIGAYRLGKLIGRGGMAVVFRAIDERLDRQVAVKVLAPVLADDEAFRQRFMRESRVAAAADDPHIIPIFEAGESEGMLFIAMRYVRGGDVRSLVRRQGALTPGRAAAILSPVASALDTAHAAGLVHRDVKPANMLLDVRPDRPDHVYLTDFGLSKHAVSSIGRTGTGHILGTPDYVAPEQISGADLDGRTDQYSLACTAFELLSSRPPFQRDHAIAVIYAHTSEPPPQLTAVRADLNPAVDAVLSKALAKSPEDRYPTCRDFTESLRQALGQPPYHLGSSGATQQYAVTNVAGSSPPVLSEARGTTITRPVGLSGEIAVGDEAPAGTAHRKRRRWNAWLVGIGVLGAVLVGAGVRQVVLHTFDGAGRRNSSSSRSPFAPIPGSLHAVAVASASSAWAVGQYCVTGCFKTTVINQSIILHWNGNKWSRVASPNTGGSSYLRAISTGQGSAAWAVGASCAAQCGTTFPKQKTLILSWNGSAWSQIRSPNPGATAYLRAISVANDGQAWAVGGFSNSVAGTTASTLILHWDGSAWTQTPSPSPGSDSSLFAVSVDPRGGAWAVGRSCVSACFTTYETDKPLILHWNGKSWSRVPSLNPAGNSYLDSVSVARTNSVWAVGMACVSGCLTSSKTYQSLTMHWDGAVWSRVISPNPGASAWLEGVTASASNGAWTVGADCVSGCNTSSESDRALILKWNGNKWSIVTNPANLGNRPILYSVSTAPPGFIVGRFCVSGCFTLSERYRTLILRWNGKALVQG